MRGLPLRHDAFVFFFEDFVKELFVAFGKVGYTTSPRTYPRRKRLFLCPFCLDKSVQSLADQLSLGARLSPGNASELEIGSFV